MIIHLNGYPGVGKLTVGRILARRLAGRLLDNHAIYDVAFALAEFRSPAWDKLARGVRDVAFQGVEALSAETPVITTNACSNSDWGREMWQALLDLAGRRCSPFLVVSMDCAPEENARRLTSDGRGGGTMTDPLALQAYRRNWRLLEHGGDALLRLDCTSLSAEDSASAIIYWVEARAASRPRGPAS